MGGIGNIFNDKNEGSKNNSFVTDGCQSRLFSNLQALSMLQSNWCRIIVGRLSECLITSCIKSLTIFHIYSHLYLINTNFSVNFIWAELVREMDFNNLEDG